MSLRHINHLFSEAFYGELKKLSKKLVTFSFLIKCLLIYVLKAHVSKTQ